MNKVWLRPFLVVLLSGYSLLSFSQQQPWEEEEGDIEDAQVIIEKDREIELPKANRNFERVPPLPIQTPSNTKLNYQFDNFTPTLSSLSPQIRVLKIKEPALDKLYGNYVKAGFGNYITPYLEGYFTNTLSDEYSHEIHVKHLSSRNGPVDDANSGSGKTRIDLGAKRFASNHTFNAGLFYQRDNYHFYGYAPELDVEEEDIRQVFNTFGIEGSIERNKALALLDYSMRASFSHLSDHYNASESQAGFNLHANYELSKVAILHLKSDLYLTNRKDGVETDNITTLNRNLFRLKPYLQYKTAIGNNMQIDLNAGFNIVHENDTLDNAGQLHFYPFALAKYHFTPSLKIYAGIDGDIERTSLQKFVGENPYLAPNVPLFHSNKRFAFQGGIEGRLGSNVSFDAGFSVSNYKNLYFFANSMQDSTKFTILYDQGNTVLLNIFGEVSIDAWENFRLTARGDYFGYSTDEVEEAWQRPNFKIDLLSTYNLYNKFLFTANLYTLGGIQGINLATNTSKKLDTITDLGFTTEYLFSEKFSAFLQLKNIFAKEYEQYLNYPSRGFMILAGITFSF